MPVIFDTELQTERQVTDAEYQAMRNQVRSERRDRLIAAPDTQGPASFRMWDCVEQAWTQPLPAYQVYQTSLRLVVFKCSACQYTTAFEGGVEAHAKQAVETAVAHQGAALHDAPSTGSLTGQVCSGCGVQFMLHKNRGRHHIEAALASGPLHKHVEEVLMKRFSLEPSEPVVLGRKVVLSTNGTQALAGPSKASQVERGVAPKRRRRRSRNRRRGHGNSAS